jgi:glycosyltransferase involved in cell wall biosynthesis
VNPNTPTPDVSIVLPVYNEKGHIEDEIQRIRTSMDASQYSYEIIVIDDGSTDGSGDLLRGIDGIRLIQFANNRGSGSSRRIGTNAARGEIVVWTDVDMTYPNDQMPNLIDDLDGVDQVVGARTSEKGTVKALRVPAKWTIRKLASYLTSTPIPDLNSGFRAMRRSVALQFLHLLPSGFSCVTTITMTFLSNGYSVKYIPIEYGERAGESKFHWYRDTKRYLLQVVRLIMMYNPLRVLMPMALFLLSIGVVKLVYDLATKNFRPAANTLLIFSAGFAVVLVAVLADLIVQVSKPQHGVEPASVYRTDLI